MGPDLRTPLPLPAGVACYAIAGTTAAKAVDEAADDPAALPGDGLVPITSALGRHEKPELTLQFTDHAISFATDHLDLLARAEVYETMRTWLASTPQTLNALPA